jgi:hypothetical protein
MLRQLVFFVALASLGSASLQAAGFVEGLLKKPADQSAESVEILRSALILMGRVSGEHITAEQKTAVSVFLASAKSILDNAALGSESKREQLNAAWETAQKTCPRIEEICADVLGFDADAPGDRFAAEAS